MTAKRILVLAVSLALFAAACGDDSDEAGGSGDGAASCAPGQTDGDLAFYNWSEYIDPELVSAFETEFGVSVTQDFYPSNEELIAKVQAGAVYDLIVPSDYMVSIMIDEGLLAPLQRGALPNIANLADRFAGGLPFDPDAEYSVPYQWGTTGLGVDLGAAGGEVPHTWGLIFDAELSAQFAGSITLLDDPRETMGPLSSTSDTR
ncbi:MAG: extracellular solute-binding protein [Acidimicrobiales bacterium]